MFSDKGGYSRNVGENMIYQLIHQVNRKKKDDQLNGHPPVTFNQ